ncbi:hypothetical protein PCCS19_17160 [Paenibacillus sp. CCS19]|uniref:carboxypeptidase regulatory-like domain-containing protein n=1 Tax=Paenibacillus sp. CCS19 TaxID=3158387 RepID=UPI00256B4F7E|nr:carboxypeptidase regulatory-like domain-containing protein [Paenibacillus cellulosilyticus]GMK38662.1 hypothetical protein PCCS19_17160 [Paenibacillus cellulosilyticus]
MAFPSNIQFVPIKVNGIPPSDPAGDVSPSAVDIVGNEQFPPAYYAYDGQNVYFRLRLQGDPRSNNSFQNFNWGVLFDYQTPPSYEFMIAVDGGRGWITLVRNGNQSTSGNPLTDPPEGADGQGFPNFHRPINNFDLARAGITNDGSSFGGTNNYFLDFFLDTGTFFSQLTINGINFNANTPVRMLFFTASTNQSFDKDSLPFSDAVTFNQANVRAQLTASGQNTLPAVITTGSVETFRRTLQVNNVGTSPAHSISVTVTPGNYVIVSANNSTPSVGNAAFDASTQTLSWNIGNLPNGQNANYQVDLTTIFPTAGQVTLDSFVVRGIDQFTGNMLPEVRVTQQITVQAAGSISGVIVDNFTGLPLSGVSITLLQAGAFQTVSDTSGVFGITGIPPGSYTLELTLVNYETQQIPITIASNQSLIQNVVLIPLPAAVHGTVFSASSGLPIANARIAIEDPPRVFIAVTFTDSSGHYKLTNLPAGKLRVDTGADDFILASYVITLQPAEDRLLDIVLEPNPSTVTGLVTAPGGQPIAGAAVRLLNEQRGLQFESVTDANGLFTLNLLVPDVLYLVRVSAVNFTAANAYVRVPPGAAETINVELQPLPGSLSGIVVEEQTGTPLGNVAVSLQELNGVSLGTTSTDDTGRFLIDSLAAGTYIISIQSTTHSNRQLSVTITSGADTFIEVSLTRLTGSLQGIVSDQQGRRLPDAAITLLLSNRPIIREFTDEEGSFVISNLVPDNYLVVARLAGFSAKQLGALIQPLQATQLTFVLQEENGRIAGTIRDDAGKPLQGVVISVSQNILGIQTFVSQSITDLSGTYAVSGLTPSEYILVASIQGFQNGTAIAVVQPGQETTVDLTLLPSPGNIAGKVTDSSGDIITNTVSVVVSDTNGVIITTIFTSVDGSYTTTDLAPGTYLLTFVANGFQSNQLTVLVQSNASSSGNIILFPLPGFVQGTLTDSVTHVPIGGAMVKASTQHGLVIEVGITDSGGFYRLTGLPPGNYSILATADNYDFVVVGATVVADTITETNFVLSQLTGNIEGVLEPPIPNVLVQLALSNNLLITSSITDNTGTFRFIELRSGSYILTAAADNFSSPPVGASVVIGDTIHTVIRLTPNPGSVAGAITADTGEPIASAVVLFYDQTETLRANGQTAQSGAYSIDNLPAGILTLIITAPGFADQSSAIRLGPGEMQTGINFVLSSVSGGISGQITDAETGDVIAGASIEIRIADASGIIIAIATTSQFGNYIVDDLRPGSYAVIMSAEGYASNAVGAIVRRDAVTGASVQLSRLRGTIVGTIVATDNVPLDNNGTSVKLFTASGTLISTLFANNEGRFIIEGVVPDTYQLSITSPSFETNSQTINVIANQINAITIKLRPQSITITGTVRHAITKAPLEGALIGINGRTAIPVETTYTDRNGLFIITFLPFGRFTLFASLPGFASVAAAENAIPGQTTNLLLEMNPNPGTVIGFVTNLQDGSIIAGAEIKLFTRSQIQLGTVLTDNNGSYEYNQLSVGDYFVIASSPGFATNQSGFTIAPGATTKLSFALQPLPGSITGTVRNALTSEPILNVIIVLRPFNNFAAPLSLTATDSSGIYLFQDLLEGNYTMNVTLFGFQLEQSSFSVIRGGVTRIDFALRPTRAGVIGVVTDSDTGAKLPDVLVVGIDDNGVIIGQGVTDQSGVYALGTGTEGSISVVSILDNFQYGLEQSILPPDQNANLNVSMKPNAARLRGVTFNADSGAPISGVVISVLTEQLVAIESIASDEEGNFRFITLRPGSYYVTATSPIYASQAQFVTVASSMESVIEFRHPTVFGTLTGTIRDAEGRPLYKALVELYLPNPTPSSNPQAGSGAGVRTSSLQQLPASKVDGIFIRSTISDQNGRYTLTNLPAGALIAVFTFPDKKPAIRQPVILAKLTTVLDVVLEDEDEE